MNKIMGDVESVLAFLKNVPLSDNTIKHYEVYLRGSIVPYCEANDINNFSDDEMQRYLEAQMLKVKDGKLTADHVIHQRRAAALLADCMQGRPLMQTRKNYKPRKLCVYFVKLLADYNAYLSQSFARNTRQGHICIIRQFLANLEQNGIQDLDKLMSDNVKDFIMTIAPNRKASMPIVTEAIRKFLFYLADKGIAFINAERFLLNPASRKRKLFPCFTDEEVDSILVSVDRSVPTGKRDYAVIMLALWTGLRAVDILGLKRSDIDWNRNVINVVQDKTDVNIQMDLSPGAGNAIADYILNGRPEIESPYIFVRHKRPFGRLGDNSVDNLMDRVLDKACISREAWDGKSFHAFRRTFSTRLVRAGIPFRSIGDMLGHTNPDSAIRYIALDNDGLRICCMDISRFRTKKAGLI